MKKIVLLAMCAILATILMGTPNAVAKYKFGKFDAKTSSYEAPLKMKKDDPLAKSSTNAKKDQEAKEETKASN